MINYWLERIPLPMAYAIIGAILSMIGWLVHPYIGTGIGVVFGTMALFQLINDLMI